MFLMYKWKKFLSRNPSIRAFPISNRKSLKLLKYFETLKKLIISPFQENLNFDQIKEERKILIENQPSLMVKESELLDSRNYLGKVHNGQARRLIQEHTEIIPSKSKLPENTMIKIEYFDTLLNLERKVEHLNKLFTKIKLRVIHKPFIILDMLKIMSDDRSGVNIFASLLGKLLKMRKRTGMDSIIEFVEHKKKVINRWGGLAERLKKVRLAEQFKIIENEQIQKQKIQRQIQKNRRGLRYLGTILNNFLREYRRKIWTVFVRKAFANEVKWTNREVSLDITDQAGFIKSKDKYEKRRVEASPDRPSEKTKDENEEGEYEHTFEVRKNQMNAYFYKNGKAQGSEYNSGDEYKKKQESSFEEEESGLQKMEMALNSGNVDPSKLLNQIRNEIERIQNKLDKDENKEEPLSLKEKIDMLNQMTHLMGLIKKYYECFKDESHDSKKIDRKDFDQVLVILQRVIARLLRKIPDEMGKVNTQENVSADEEREEFQSNQKTLEDVNRELTKEMAGLLNLIEPKVGIKPEAEGYETEKNEQFESAHPDGVEQFQSVTGINGLLEEMMNNLNAMNENIETNKGSLYKLTPDAAPYSQEGGSVFETGDRQLTNSNQNLNSGTLGSDDFLEKPVSGAPNPRFPTFHQPQHFVKAQADPNSLSFRKKMAPTNNRFPSNPKYASSEFFNFYGVLNFKVKKFNKFLIKEAFDLIYDRACDMESRHRMFAYGTLVRKDNCLLQLSRLATEVNRRFNIRNQNLFRMAKGLTSKAKICLRMLKLFRKGQFSRGSPRNIEEHPRFIGTFYIIFSKLF